MKRCFSAIFICFLFLFSSCSKQALCDADSFCKRMGENSNILEINPLNAIIEKGEKDTLYSWFLSEKGNSRILIRTYCDSKKGTIKKCTVTFYHDKENNRKDSIYIFKEICKSTIDALSADKEDSNIVFRELQMPKDDVFKKSVPQYFSSNFYNYTYISNELGAFFMIENKRFFEDESSNLTLRSESLPLK